MITQAWLRRLQMLYNQWLMIICMCMCVFFFLSKIDSTKNSFVTGYKYANLQFIYSQWTAHRLHHLLLNQLLLPLLLLLRYRWKQLSAKDLKAQKGWKAAKKSSPENCSRITCFYWSKTSQTRRFSRTGWRKYPKSPETKHQTRPECWH